jgi:hypothetical protein
MSELPPDWLPGSDRWAIKHMSGKYIISKSLVNGEPRYAVWKYAAKRLFNCFGIYSSRDDAIAAVKFQSPNRISIDEVA